MAIGKTVKGGAGKKSRDARERAAAGKPAALSDSYFNLVRRHPLRTIRDDRELDRAISLVNRLIDMRERDAGEDAYLDVLGTLIHDYESTRYPMEPVSPEAMLAHLIEARGVTQAAVVAATGIDKTTLSLLLSGKRPPTRAHVIALAKYFKVDPGVFLQGP